MLFFPSSRRAASPPSRTPTRVGSYWSSRPVSFLLCPSFPYQEGQRGGVVRGGYDENYETIKRASTTRFYVARLGAANFTTDYSSLFLASFNFGVHGDTSAESISVETIVLRARRGLVMRTNITKRITIA